MQDESKHGGLSRDPVLIADAVRELAKFDRRPGDTRRTAENRVRTRIRDALVRKQALEQVDDAAGPAISRKQFCAWAFNTWGERVRELKGYVHNVTVELTGLEARATCGIAGGVVWQPDSPAWLRENYPKAEGARQLLEHENAELRQQLKTLTAENDHLRARLKLRRDRASEHGKKGGRGHGR